MLSIRGGAFSLNVLYLLPDPLELRLQIDDAMGNRRVAPLGTERVGLATHLLEQELESTPHRTPPLAVREHGPEFNICQIRQKLGYP